MEIQIRRVGPYRNVEVVFDNITTSLGLNDADECMALAVKLKTAIGELLDQNAYEALMECDM